MSSLLCFHVILFFFCSIIASSSLCYGEMKEFHFKLKWNLSFAWKFIKRTFYYREAPLFVFFFFVMDQSKWSLSPKKTWESPHIINANHNKYPQICKNKTIMMLNKVRKKL
jgi:hypothetical protein